MYKSNIIEAIQNKQMLRIKWKKETTGQYSECDISPYDVFPKSKKDSYRERDILLGVEYEKFGYKDHVANIYLDTIHNVEVLNQCFDGNEVKRIINPKLNPVIPRNW